MQVSVAAFLAFAWCVPAMAQGIYTCVDAKGRRLTSDRPIIDCIDREQKELSPGGTVVRRLGPSLTAAERAAEEEKERKIQAERFRINEEKRRDRALLTRYPSKTVHDRERVLAIQQVDEVTVLASKRSVELVKQHKELLEEAEFYKADPSKLPVRLRRLIEENEQLQVAQKRYIEGQSAEKQRVNARFDEELVRLKQLWALQAMPAGGAPSVAPLPPAAPARK